MFLPRTYPPKDGMSTTLSRSPTIPLNRRSSQPERSSFLTRGLHSAVVSDIDDTVLRTGLTEGFVAVRQTLLGSASTRREIPGMPALYQGLASGIGNKPEPAFYYLSTGTVEPFTKCSLSSWISEDSLGVSFTSRTGVPRAIRDAIRQGTQATLPGEDVCCLPEDQICAHRRFRTKRSLRLCRGSA